MQRGPGGHTNPTLPSFPTLSYPMVGHDLRFKLLTKASL